MEREFLELPDWTFLVEEVSAGVYEVTGTDSAGHRVQANGVDPDAVLCECRRNAVRLATQIARRLI